MIRENRHLKLKMYLLQITTEVHNYPYGPDDICHINRLPRTLDEYYAYVSLIFWQLQTNYVYKLTHVAIEEQVFIFHHQFPLSYSYSVFLIASTFFSYYKIKTVFGTSCTKKHIWPGERYFATFYYNNFSTCWIIFLPFLWICWVKRIWISLA